MTDTFVLCAFRAVVAEYVGRMKDSPDLFVVGSINFICTIAAPCSGYSRAQPLR